MAEKRKFTSKRKQEVVEIDGKDYLLVEFTGPVRDQFMNWQKDQIEIEGEGKDRTVKVLNYTNQSSYLLERTLHTIKDDGVTADKLVGEEFIKNMPSSLQFELYVIAAEVCGITVKAVEEAKNSSEGQTDPEKTPNGSD